MPPRYAVYFTPEQHNLVYRLGSTWLRYDAYQSETCPELAPTALFESLGDINTFIQSPRLYGFHATLKPPFRLHSEQTSENLKAAMRQFAKQTAPFSCAPLEVQQIGHFLALTPRTPCTGLELLARKCVQSFEPFRAELTDSEYQKRKPDSLSPRQLSLLKRWGYPYVMEEFRFHMTLTNRLNDALIQPLQLALTQFFSSVLDRPLLIDRIALFFQPDETSPFRIIDSFELTG